MNIANIFCQSLGITSHPKTFLTVCNFLMDLVSDGSGYPFKKIIIHSNGLGYLFGKNCHPFERPAIGLSVRSLK